MNRISFWKGSFMLKPNHSWIISDKSRIGTVSIRDARNFFWIPLCDGHDQHGYRDWLVSYVQNALSDSSKLYVCSFDSPIYGRGLNMTYVIFNTSEMNMHEGNHRPGKLYRMWSMRGCMPRSIPTSRRRKISIVEKYQKGGPDKGEVKDELASCIESAKDSCPVEAINVE